MWAAEVIHPYWEFSFAGYAVDIASPDGGEIKIDGFSDPEDASKYAAWYYLSLGFLKGPEKVALMKNTLKLSLVNPKDYKAILVCGGQGPYTLLLTAMIIDQFELLGAAIHPINWQRAVGVLLLCGGVFLIKKF